MLKRTPLFNIHKKLGAKIVEFGGWEMPVQYTNVIEEHLATRNKAGLFDISHMGEFDIRGKDASAFLQKIITNDINKLEDGKAQYACMCYENGGTIDDCFVYRFSQDHFMMVVNAGTIEKDFNWLKKNIGGFEVELADNSDKTAKLDLQGPESENILQQLTGAQLPQLKRFFFIQDKIDGTNMIISRTGYTGEDGFELYFASDKAEDIWNRLMEAGNNLGMKPIGLGARDTLRIEACYSLYGHELSDDITPIEGGVGWVVRNDKGAFIGSEVLLKQKREGTKKVNVAIEMVDRGIMREHYPIFKDNVQIGETSSGTFSPLFRKSIGMGFVDPVYKEPETPIQIKIRDKLLNAKVVKKPFYTFCGE